MFSSYVFADVNEAFADLTYVFKTEIDRVGRDSNYGVEENDTRYGPVYNKIGPLMAMYRNPRMKVLFNTTRNANPFFHLYEALWMLAGRDDVKSLSFYSSKIAQFSDDGIIIPGAYGTRWAVSNPKLGNQLRQIAEHLIATPNSRRAVLGMWDYKHDLPRIAISKDVPCNTHAYFSITKSSVNQAEKVLNMTVCNRSNDLVLGMLGANYVHFSFLLEYMASLIGVKVGTYTQFTNNLHIYKKDMKFQEWKESLPVIWYNDLLALHARKGGTYERLDLIKAEVSPQLANDIHKNHTSLDIRMSNLSQDIDFIVSVFNGESYNNLHLDHIPEITCSHFLNQIAMPMLKAFHCYKYNDFTNAYRHLERMPENNDWRIAGTNWIKKIETTRLTKSQNSGETNVS